MSRAFTLFRLQQVDTQLDRSRARLAEIESLLAEDAVVKLAQAALNTARDLSAEKKRALTTAEENSRAHRIKIEQTESHLYSGRVTAPKELQDLQNEVAALKRYLETLEDRQLEAMLAFEEAEEERKRAQATFDRIEAENQDENAVLTAEKNRLNAEIAKLVTERTVAVVSVKADDRAIYDKLRKQRRGVAVAEASSRSCSACGTSLNAALYQAARMSDKLARCETCGRILYIG